MCVIGNKVDLRQQRAEGSCVGTLQGEKLAKVGFSFQVLPLSSPQGLNTLSAVRYDCLCADVRSLVLRNERQRRNQRGRGRASSREVGRWKEFQVFFLHKQ